MQMMFPAEKRKGLRRGAQRLFLVWLFSTATLCACLCAPQREPTTELTTGQARAYAELLKLRVPAAHALLRTENPASPGTLLVADCIEMVEILISQDATRYSAVQEAQDRRLSALEKAPQTPLRDYARAEISLHQAVTQVVFEHEVQGAWNLRQAYQQMQTVVKRYPDYLPARKSLGMLQFAIGSLPEGYRWFLRLLGLNGSVDGGLKHLRAAAQEPHDFQLESQLILALIEETYLRRSTETTQLVTRLAAQQPDNLLFTFLVISQNKKLHRTDRALAAFRTRPAGPTYLPVPYLHHMAADLLLYQGQYAASERENLQFLQLYRGQHYRKAAAFKLYLAAWLGGKQTAADRYRQQIAAGGRTVVEEDTYAQRFYEDKTPLHPILTRARLQLDGGYYQEALTTLQTFTSTQRTTLRDRLEAPYRRARAYHGLGQLDSARHYYARTIALARGQAPYYFAPQAALQLGYLYQAAGQNQLARTYFQQALHYPKHEYKNSTDMKAKVALAEL
jgi:tetratricopeptide (TPR) repeat protein